MRSSHIEDQTKKSHVGEEEESVPGKELFTLIYGFHFFMLCLLVELIYKHGVCHFELVAFFYKLPSFWVQQVFFRK